VFRQTRLAAFWRSTACAEKRSRDARLELHHAATQTRDRLAQAALSLRQITPENGSICTRADIAA
jgi:hypothetical protein